MKKKNKEKEKEEKEKKIDRYRKRWLTDGGKV